MRRLVLAALLSLMAVAAAAQEAEVAEELRNPVIPGFSPAPSCVVVDTCCYVVNPSLFYFPGIPVYCSTDLQNWTQLGNALTKPSQLPLAPGTAGILAASIAYNNGHFYIVYSNSGNGGNFLVSADDPVGPWSEPVKLEQKGGDPSLFFDEGKCYLATVQEGDVLLAEINLKNGNNFKSGRPVFRGGFCPESPRFFRKDRWYYMLTSAGGYIYTARSRDIYGPYEPSPYNPVFSQNQADAAACEIRDAGRGDMLRAGDGSWWMLLQAHRCFGGDFHFIGKETFLAPVNWAGGWPHVNDGEPLRDTMQVSLPHIPEEKLFGSWEYGFDSIGPEWMYIRQPETKNYSFTGGHLSLTGTGEGFSSDRPTALLMRQRSAYCIFATSVKVNSRNGDAGIGIYQSELGYAEFFVRKRAGKYNLVVRVRTRSVLHEEVVLKLNRPSADLLVRAHGDRYEFYFAGKEIARVDSALLSSEVAGGEGGVVIGPYCISGQAEFSGFSYEEN